MKLSTRMTLLSLGITFMTAFVVVIVFNSNNTRDYRAVEEHVFERRIAEKAELLEESLIEMELFVRDWAYWDVAYAYIHGENETFVEDNMTLQSYMDYGMDYLVIFDGSMERVYDAKFNQSEWQLDRVQPKIVNAFKEVGYATGIMEIDGQWIVYSGAPINKNQGEAEDEGLLIFAYDLTPEIARRSGRIINVELDRTIVTYDQRDEGYSVVTGKDESAYGIETGFVHTTDVLSKAYIYYPVLNKSEELQMSFVMHNSIQELGNKHNVEKTVLIIIAMMGLGGILTWLVRYMLISRIVNLESQMDRITAKGCVDERIVEHHNDELGRLSHGINNMLDELESVHDEIKYLAEHDELTGTLTRRAGLALLDKGIGRSKRTNQQLTIAYVDIDRLKVVNDGYGHIEGDVLIKTVAGCVVEALGDKGHVVRMGGDEFLVIMENMTEEGAKEMMEHGRQLLESKVGMLQPEYSMSFSYGVMSYDWVIDMDAFVELADKSMYRQRSRHRDNH